MVNTQLLRYTAVGRSIWGENFFFIMFVQIDPSPRSHLYLEQVIVKQPPPYNLYGVFPLQPFLPLVKHYYALTIAEIQGRSTL